MKRLLLATVFLTISFSAFSQEWTSSAVSVGEPIQLQQKESIARIELFTEAAKNPTDWHITAHFEQGNYNGNVLVGVTKFGTRQTTRQFGQIAKQQFTVTDPVTKKSVTVSSAGIAELLRKALYDFRLEDIKNEISSREEIKQ